MTTEQFERDVRTRLKSITATEKAIVSHVRGLVGVLKDCNRKNSAEELEALFFLLDAQTQELEKFGDENEATFLDLVKSRFT